MRIPTHPRQRHFIAILPYILPVIFFILLLDMCFDILPEPPARKLQQNQSQAN